MFFFFQVTPLEKFLNRSRLKVLISWDRVCPSLVSVILNGFVMLRRFTYSLIGLVSKFLTCGRVYP